MSDGSVTIEVTLTKEELEAGLKSINKDLETLEKPATSVSKSISSGFNSIGKVATKAGTALTAGLTVPLIALGTAGVKYNAQMEDFEANLTTLLGNADKAKAMLNDLKEMANTTPFETTDLLEATQMMLGFGLAADKTQGYLQTLGDISMGNSEKLMSLTRAFSQIGASGKATMEDINQMIDAGFNPLQIMAEQTGKSMAELRDEISDGKISFEDIAKAMQIATSEGGRYYNAMEKASQTMNGKFSTAMDALNTALGNLTQSLLPIVTKIVEKITEWANAFANLDEKTQKTILKIAGIVAIAGPTLTIFGNISTGISSLIDMFGKLGSSLFESSGAIKGLGGALKALAGPAGIIIAVVAGIIAILVALYKTSESFRNTVNKAFEQIKNSFQNMWNTLKPALEQLGQAFMSLLQKIEPLASFLVNVLAVAFTVIINVLTAVITIITQVITFFVNLVTTIITFFTETIPNAFNNFVTTVSNFVNSVIEWFKNLPYNLGLLIGQAIGHVINFGIRLVEFVRTDIPNFINGVVNWFKELPGRVWQWLLNTINNVINFGRDLGKRASDAGQSLVDNIINTIRDLPNKIYEIGKNIVEGLWRGITGMGNWIKDKVSGFFSGIVDGVKGVLGIHSPSRVFRDQIGKNMALGVGEGFNKSINEVYKRMKSVVDFETQKLATNLSTTANISRSLNATITVEGGDIYMDSTKVGRAVTPTITKTLKGAGAY